jgi:ATP-dependent DNA ligase
MSASPESRHAGDGEIMFQPACKLGLDDIVSRRSDQPYQSGRSKAWLEIKYPYSPAMRRPQEQTW